MEWARAALSESTRWRAQQISNTLTARSGRSAPDLDSWPSSILIVCKSSANTHSPMVPCKILERKWHSIGPNADSISLFESRFCFLIERSTGRTFDGCTSPFGLSVYWCLADVFGYLGGSIGALTVQIAHGPLESPWRQGDRARPKILSAAIRLAPLVQQAPRLNVNKIANSFCKVFGFLSC